MPGHEEEGKHIVRWLADNVSKDLYVHVMEQYHPRAHVGKGRRTTSGRAKDVAEGIVEAKKQLRYEEINRPVSLAEVDSVRKAAEQAGLWRFVDAAEHGGFNM